MKQETDTAVRGDDVPAQYLSGKRLISEVGRGGMGSVWLALDERLGRTVAIKLLRADFATDETVRTRFMREARALARLSHPSIVRIYDLGEEPEVPHYVMEYVEGVPLNVAAQNLDLRSKVELLRKVLLAVEYLHEHEIVHRDLKPRNILVGPDMEPKLLDFGLARIREQDPQRLTVSGELLGTPSYLAPEQTFAEETADPRSDIFSLGVVLYELLTGALPFHGETFAEQAMLIREADPVLPRRLNPAIPGDLQNICMKALEKDPALRYASAREFADDLARFLANEPVVAAPTVYSRLLTGKIAQHVNEITGWRNDQAITEHDFGRLRRIYENLVEREDAWLMELRRLSLSQVSQYLGAWVMVVGGALIFLFSYPRLTHGRGLAVVLAALVPTFWWGIKLWRSGQHRGALSYLLAACLLLPTAMVVAMQQFHWLTWLSKGKEGLDPLVGVEGFNDTTNAQMWWAVFCSLPVDVWLRRFTQATVFSMVTAFMGFLLGCITLLRMGWLDWVKDDPGQAVLRLLPIALIFYAVGVLLERRKLYSDSQYWYPFAVLATAVSLTVLAGYGKAYEEWLTRTFYWSDGDREYLFLMNAAFFYTLGTVAEWIDTRQMRNISKLFSFTVPGHVMFPLLFLGLAATDRWDKFHDILAVRAEARMFEFLLPAVACIFVFWSIPRDMKNYVGSGLFFLAVGIVRIQQDFYKDRALWPVLLMIGGTVIMALATNYAGIRVMLLRSLRRR